MARPKKKADTPPAKPKDDERTAPKQAGTPGMIGNGANLGFEAQPFLAADRLRKNLEPSDHEHIALGLTVLKHIAGASDPLAQSESAREVMGGRTLRVVAHELVAVIKGNLTVDGSTANSARDQHPQSCQAPAAQVRRSGRSTGRRRAERPPAAEAVSAEWVA
jgi:hypothetical protein